MYSVLNDKCSNHIMLLKMKLRQKGSLFLRNHSGQKEKIITR